MLFPLISHLSICFHIYFLLLEKGLHLSASVKALWSLLGDATDLTATPHPVGADSPVRRLQFLTRAEGDVVSPIGKDPSGGGID